MRSGTDPFFNRFVLMRGCLDIIIKFGVIYIDMKAHIVDSLLVPDACQNVVLFAFSLSSLSLIIQLKSLYKFICYAWTQIHSVAFCVWSMIFYPFDFNLGSNWMFLCLYLFQ